MDHSHLYHLHQQPPSTSGDDRTNPRTPLISTPHGSEETPLISTPHNSDIGALIDSLQSLEHTLKQHTSYVSRGSVSSQGLPINLSPMTQRRVRPPSPSDSPPGTLGSVPENKDEKKDHKVTVYIRVVFLKVGEINTLKENYAADVYVQAKWREPHLDGKSQMDSEEINWDECWTPQLFVENLLGEGKETMWYMVTYDSEQRATVYEKRRVSGNFLEYLELEQFPFDTQDLTITVTTERSETEVELVEDHSEISGINIQSFVDEQEWRLHNHIETWRKVTTKVFDNAKFRHPALSAACKATRRPGFFIWNILFVMLFICSLAFTTFTVNIELPQNRLQLSFILLLTTVTFKFVVNQSLPRISYLTYLDKYILTSMTILCLICVWHSIVPHIDTNGNKALIADMIALGVLGFTYVFFHVFFFTWIYFNATRKQWKIFRKDQDYKEKMRLMEKSPDKWTAKVEPAYGSFT